MKTDTVFAAFALVVSILAVPTPTPGVIAASGSTQLGQRISSRTPGGSMKRQERLSTTVEQGQRAVLIYRGHRENEKRDPQDKRVLVPSGKGKVNEDGTVPTRL
ncbi:hypothetical protein P154DRAFT_532236 [Amniculicola lignicola CBS 123094]|uniref:Uncharacterized protein n=1 Tax=Amniculicola lignicola CBS 123094 TaxID=1392246 RepID=A0A6A5WPM4_9PLEO|nr:hypothetical protein P154DRAFT_532236 [Amniculicola lignicola CBS 123094]